MMMMMKGKKNYIFSAGKKRPINKQACELRGQKWDMLCGGKKKQKKRMTMMLGWNPPFVPYMHAREIPEFKLNYTQIQFGTHGIRIIHAFLQKKPLCCFSSLYSQRVFWCFFFMHPSVQSVENNMHQKKNRVCGLLMCLSMVRCTVPETWGWAAAANQSNSTSIYARSRCFKMLLQQFLDDIQPDKHSFIKRRALYSRRCALIPP